MSLVRACGWSRVASVLVLGASLVGCDAVLGLGDLKDGPPPDGGTEASVGIQPDGGPSSTPDGDVDSTIPDTGIGSDATPDGDVDSTIPDAGIGSDAGHDAAGDADDDAVADSGTGSDADAANACTPGCSSPTTLHSCPANTPPTDQTCPLGCLASGTPHCAVLQPSAPVTAADLTAAGVGDLVVTTSLFVHTDTGAIDGIRVANAVPGTYEVVAGIGFALFAGSNVGVFTVKSLTVNDTISMQVKGKAALAVAAATTITIQGILDARGYDAAGVICDAESTSANTAVGPGGGAGGTSGDATGAGGGHAGDVGGGGGGGFGGGGGNGGLSPGDTFAGASLGGSSVAFPPIIAGGFGAGRSGGGGGGGGGGGVQLVAGSEIRIGGGTSGGGINVGGCGGVGGAGALAQEGGGGGGSGGAILLQSPAITMITKGVLAANGGAGGSGAGRGPAGNLSDQPALPIPLSGGAMGAGGSGSAAAALSGSAGAVCTTNPGSCFAGGGGGGAGFIHVQNAAGTLTLPVGATISPSLGSAASSASKVPTQ